MLNKVQIIGNLGADPEIRSTASGEKIANLRVAVSERWTDKSGEKKERTEWFRVVIFNDRTADVAERYLKKGAKVYVEGSLTTRKWTDKDGTDRYSTEVVISRFKGELTMLDTRGSGESAEPRGEPQQRQAAPRQQQAPDSRKSQYAGAGSDLDSEIPF